MGTLFCRDCGTALLPSTEEFPDNIELQLNHHFNPGDTISESSPSGVAHPAAIRLKLLKKGQIISLHGKSSFILGRGSRSQTASPDVDLTKNNAYEQGVSRQHAIIDISDQEISITDLEARNGTWVNGIKISPGQPKKLKDTDIIFIGKLKIQILINN